MTDQFPRFIPRQPGQSMTEYALIGALVALLAIPAMLFLGGHLSGILGGMVSGGKDTVQLANTVPAIQATDEDAPSKPAASTGEAAQAVIGTAKGTMLIIANYPEKLSESVQTVGANGTTELLASQMAEMARQLVSTGELTEDQYDKFMMLANQGHRMAEMEKLVENAFKTTSKPSDLQKRNIVFDGYVYSAENINYMLGFDTGDIALNGGLVNDPTVVSDPLTDSRAREEILVFQNMYKDLLASGALQDPAVKQVVESLARDIGSLSNIISCAGMAVLYEDVPLDTLQDKLVSDTTHLDSQGICSTGSGKDSGTNCSG